MTSQQRINKIEKLEFWLNANPSHPDYSTVLGDKLKLDKQHKEEITKAPLLNE